MGLVRAPPSGRGGRAAQRETPRASASSGGIRGSRRWCRSTSTTFAGARVTSARSGCAATSCSTAGGMTASACPHASRPRPRRVIRRPAAIVCGRAWSGSARCCPHGRSLRQRSPRGSAKSCWRSACRAPCGPPRAWPARLGRGRPSSTPSPARPTTSPRGAAGDGGRRVAEAPRPSPCRPGAIVLAPGPQPVSDTARPVSGHMTLNP
jgi:hypothetical protein